MADAAIDARAGHDEGMRMVFLGRKIAVGLAVLVVATMVPLVLLQHSGIASAGLSRGVAAPMENTYHLLLFLTIGLWGAWLGRESIVLLPFAALLMLGLGVVVHTPDMQSEWRNGLIVTVVQFYALTLGVMNRRYFLLGAALLGSMCFWVGGQYVPMRPEIAPPLYYLLGIALCGLLMTAIGAAIGMAILTHVKPVLGRKKA